MTTPKEIRTLLESLGQFWNVHNIEEVQVEEDEGGAPQEFKQYVWDALESLNHALRSMDDYEDSRFDNHRGHQDWSEDQKNQELYLVHQAMAHLEKINTRERP